MSALRFTSSPIDVRTLTQEPARIARQTPMQRQHIHGRIRPMDYPRVGVLSRLFRGAA